MVKLTNSSYCSLNTDSECMLTPEESMDIQNKIGADIIMQLDDVVNVTETDYERFSEATDRSTDFFFIFGIFVPMTNVQFLLL